MKQAPYDECKNCLATPFCKRYSGEVETPPYPEWCNPKFRLDKALELSRIPKKYLTANLYNFEVDDDNRYLYEGLKPYIDNIVEEVENGTNFFFYSNRTGTGKTYLGAMLLNHYIYKTCTTGKFDFETPLALFVNYTDLIDDVRYRREDDSVQHLLEMAKKTPLLLLDDLGAGTTSPFTVEQTYLILNHRKDNCLSTVITSNFDISTLSREDFFGRRNVSRIMEGAVGIEVVGKDRRKSSVRGVIKP